MMIVIRIDNGDGDNKQIDDVDGSVDDDNDDQIEHALLIQGGGVQLTNPEGLLNSINKVNAVENYLSVLVSSVVSSDTVAYAAMNMPNSPD